MELLIGAIVLSFLLLLVFGAFVFLVYQMYLSPSAIRRRGIRLQARADYDQARGTAHLQMLREAQHRKNAALGQCNQQIAATQNRIAQFEREQQERLRDTLERHLTYTRLTEVSGIGPKLRDRILGAGFRSRLADLSQAYRIQGVGPARQQAINTWIQHYTRQIQMLLNEDFPGKQEILMRYQKQLDDLRAQINCLVERRDQVSNHLQCLHGPITELGPVGVNEFVKALRDPLHVSPVVDKYLIGLFAEWELTPEWFRELTAVENL